MTDRILSVKTTMASVNKSRTTIWRDVKAGTFPPPVILGKNSIGFHEKEIRAWQKSRERAWVPDGAKVDAEKASWEATDVDGKDEERSHSSGTGEPGDTLEDANADAEAEAAVA